MTQYQITVNSELLHHLFSTNAKDSGMAKLLESVLNQVLEAQVTEHVGATRYERTEERQAYRNVSRTRGLTRKISQITEELCGAEFSKSTISNLCKQLDPIVQAWNLTW